MLWFIFVGHTLQLCCGLICVGFVVHRDLVSGVLMIGLFGCYFAHTVKESTTVQQATTARNECKFMKLYAYQASFV